VRKNRGAIHQANAALVPGRVTVSFLKLKYQLLKSEILTSNFIYRVFPVDKNFKLSESEYKLQILKSLKQFFGEVSD
jgi:hypothetical protein